MVSSHLPESPVFAELTELVSRRIGLLDGGMGSLIQQYKLEEEDYRRGGYESHPSPLKGCNDLLVLTRPDVILAIHKAYVDAGVDILETNTFNANAISMADYGLEAEVAAMNRAAVTLARQATVGAGRRVFVAGSIGPTTKVASISPDVNNPGFRAVDFDGLVATFVEQVEAMLDAGVDLLLPETTIDTLNLKAALFAIESVFEARGQRIPVITSVTIPDRSGRTLSGQTVEAFWTSIAHARPFAVSINCALGAADMRPFVEALATNAPVPLLCYPNAGLPNEMGGYDDTPESMAAVLAGFARDGLVNLVGGCCGTTPAHIRAIGAAVAGIPPRVPPAPRHRAIWSGLENYELFDGANFTMVGERTNVSGSKRFRDLIKQGEFEKALDVARQQVEGGANILDVNMDEGLLDAPVAMRTFLNHVASDPAVARLPIMVDSSRFEVIEAGLKCVQGKAIVNSLSLKEGEAAFLEQARRVRRYGAAVVVMAFDETGQATDADHRVSICVRAYRILTEQAGFAPEDIIFDPNILAIGTGIEEHDDYALSFIEAVKRIKGTHGYVAACPGALISGGVSNLSFAFRGNDRIREAIHAVFLYHAIDAGMDMGIVNAGQLAIYDQLDAELRERATDLVLNRRPDATERLIAWGAGAAASASGTTMAGRAAATRESRRELPLTQRITDAIVAGSADYVDEDMAEALSSGAYAAPLEIIEGPLMAGMSVVGERFGAGKMFLPQVVKSARVMKKAVAYLEPYLAAAQEASGLEASAGKGRILIATVKGDVHDIGKNIVAVVLRCNGYEVVDLGVMVPADKILDEALRIGASAVGLSGLITPSLDEMVYVAREMTRRGITLPLLIGGATTSKKHTSVRIAPAYAGTVMHVLDASRAVTSVSRLLSITDGPAYALENRREQEDIARRYEATRQAQSLVSLEQARARGLKVSDAGAPSRAPDFIGSRIVTCPADSLADWIDWGPFFLTWELKASWEKQLEDPEVGPRYRELLNDAKSMLARFVTSGVLPTAVYGFYPAQRAGDDVILGDVPGGTTTLHTLRQQTPGDDVRPCLALADFVRPCLALADFVRPNDHVGLFVATGGDVSALVKTFEADHDDYQAILAKAVADRLAEAMTEWLHARMRTEWGVPDPSDVTMRDRFKSRFQGIRPAPGYPAQPDHTEKRTIFEVLEAGRIGVTLTESCAMTPAASVSGIVFAHVDSTYFAVGRVGRDQVVDYARRKGIRLEDAESALREILAYDPS